jgi:hypothetical protein
MCYPHFMALKFLSPPQLEAAPYAADEQLPGVVDCEDSYPRCEPWCWNMYLQKLGHLWGFYVGVYIPAPWSIWVCK